MCVKLILLISNVLSFMLFALDKAMAIFFKKRVPEKALIFSAFCFGGVGALVSMWAFRHKTKKIKFLVVIPVLMILQIGVVIWLTHN